MWSFTSSRKTTLNEQCQVRTRLVAVVPYFFRTVILIWHPQRDSNPCCKIESLESLAAERWGQELDHVEPSTRFERAIPCYQHGKVSSYLHNGMEFGTEGRSRTPNLLIQSQTFCQLNYLGKIA